jgi:DNA repair exonuclease SbcCD ATPase subunit
MSDTYIDIMLQSLRKKLAVLDEIVRLDDLQKQQLENPESPVEDFDRTVEDKAAQIEQLEQLDEGFEKLYQHVRDELQQNQEAHAAQIKELQEAIRRITERGVQIEAQEARNKELMTQRFARAKKQGRAVRVNARATTQYYQNMKQVNLIDPQFLDNKQ